MFDKEVKNSSINGFYKIPTLLGYAISVNGIVLNEKTREEINQHVGGGYLYIAINNVSYAIHRLIADTFICKNGFDDNAIVNHKDGIKTNNNYQNIEWATFSSNLNHAYASGLRNDNVPILIKDLRSNEILRFYSLGECGRYFKTSAATIFYLLKKRTVIKPCFDYYLIIREGEDWPSVGPEIIGQHRKTQSFPVYVEMNDDDVEHKRIIFSGVGEAARYLNISVSSLSRDLHKAKSKNCIFFQKKKCKVAFLKDVKDVCADKIMNYQRKIDLSKRKPRPPKRIEVTDLENGTCTEMISLDFLARKLGIKKSALQKHIWVNNGIWKNKLRIKYLNH